MISDALGIATVLIPRSPGATSAEGLLFSDVRVDHVITDVQREDEFDVQRLDQEFAEARNRVVADLEREGFASDEMRLEGYVDIRYAQQAYEIRVPLEENTHHLTAATFASAVKQFHAAHDDQYGYSYEGRQLTEVVNVGLTGFGLLRRPPLREQVQGASLDWDGALKYTRPVYDRAQGAMIDCPVYDRTSAPVGTDLAGPAVIEQYDATLFLDPGWSLAATEFGHLVLKRI
jgi:N-methylhydantoinase A